MPRAQRSVRAAASDFAGDDAVGASVGQLARRVCADEIEDQIQRLVHRQGAASLADRLYQCHLLVFMSARCALDRQTSAPRLL